MYTINDYNAGKIAVACYSNDEYDEFKKEAIDISTASYLMASRLDSECIHGVGYSIEDGIATWDNLKSYEEDGITVVPYSDLVIERASDFDYMDFMAMIGGEQ